MRDCANYLGKSSMADIDGFDCKVMRDYALAFARNPKAERDYAENAERYENKAKAILDKADSMNCK